jgi:LmbE family N-acetylglucosaminyl deacetylase
VRIVTILKILLSLLIQSKKTNSLNNHPMCKSITLVIFLLTAHFVSAQQRAETPKIPIRVIVFGAHPDDCDLGAGGLAALYVSQGHKVKFVSLTNGDMGHHEIGGGELARRRLKEAREAGRRLGVEYEVLDNHDGELLPTLENRMQVIRAIREWNADIVIAPRTNDYHPDHRNTGVLVQDAAYLVVVPNILSSVPPVTKNPLFLYVRDRFQRPNPFRPDIVIDISPVYAKKIEELDAHVSQFYEWLPWVSGDLANVPTDKEERKKWLQGSIERRSPITPEIKLSLEKWYGKDKSAQIKLVEAFEICEYGKQPTEQNIRSLFPMLQAQ